MLELNQRWINFLGLTLEPFPDDAPAYTIEECFVMLERKFQAGGFYKIMNKGTACVRVSDMVLDDKKRQVNLLFQYADSKISDPAFSELQSGKLRSEPKLQGEGVAVSAHCIVCLDPMNAGGLEYLMLLEDAPGIGRSKLAPFINSFLKELLSREVITEEGNPIISYPVISLYPCASKTLVEDLRDGELKFIELVRNHTVRELDEEPYLERMSQTLKIKAVRNDGGEEAVSFINRVKNFGKEKGFRDMRIVFKRSEGNERSVRVPTFREDAGDAMLGKVEVISTDYDLEQCAPQLNVDFLNAMRELL